MFNIPIDEIKIQDIEQFLQSGVRERTIVEFKEQFPNKLEKFIASMANTFGGIILIGVEETATGEGKLPIKGLPLDAGLRERVIQIGLDAIYPPLIPEVRVVEFKSDTALAQDDRAVVVIRVHESEEGGHAVDQRTAVYVRVDNVSDRIRKATVEEIEWFSNKRQKSLAEKNRAIQQAQQHAQQFLIRLRHRFQRPTSEPKGRFVIWTVPTFPRLPLATLKELYRDSQQFIRQTPFPFGFFPWGGAHPVYEGVYWATEELKDYYYTELHQQGLIYSEFEFWWDRQAEGGFYPEAAASFLSFTSRFSRNIYRHFGYFGLFDLGLRLVGVRNRSIRPATLDEPKMLDDVMEVTAKISAAASEEELMAKAKEIIRQIYWAFGWDVNDNRLEDDFK